MAAAVDIKMDRLELNPRAGANARIDAVDRIQQKTIEAQGIHTLMREMIEPDRQTVNRLQKRQNKTRETVLKTGQLGEFTLLSYKVDDNLLSSEEQTVVQSLKRRTGQKFKSKKEDPQERGYHAKQEKENQTSLGYRRVA